MDQSGQPISRESFTARIKSLFIVFNVPGNKTRFSVELPGLATVKQEALQV